MAETATEKPPVFVVRFRGGMADGVYRLAVGFVPPGVTVERDGETRDYEYAGAEEQWLHQNVYDKASRCSVRVSRVEAVYHIFRPAAEVK